ncbi:phage tail spike protein [Facklamia hominis]|uniref:Phage minor structural protein n=1 Tax=Facklamia hominis CCUG 36813 TaxID=883111 RepID=K1LII6_9LACT|nr:phage tail spike protein [Facklamia hominis]EKB54456.1 phage minor structural protein [Facklamia hominis CCUG 36813]
MIYLFNNQEKLLKILSDKTLKSVEQVQTLTDEKYISDKLFVELRNVNDELLSEVEYVAIHNAENPQKFDLYFLLRYRHDGELTILDCVQSGIEELMKTPVYDIRPTGDVRLHAERILKDSRWTVQYTPSKPNITRTYYYEDAFTALKKLCASFNVEMQFHVEINNNRIGNRYIEFKNRIGTATHKRVTYGHNALSIVKETQRDDIYTAMIGRGRGEQVSEAGQENPDGKVQERDGYGRKITFEDIEWSKAKGNPVDKPKGQKYIELPEATAQFGIITDKGAVPKIGFVEFDTEDKNDLIQRTYETLLEYSRPRVELKTSAVYLDAKIGDTVRVVRHDLKIDYPVRVFEVKWDRLTNSVVELKLGDILHESASKRQSRMMNAIRDAVAEGQDEIVDKLKDNLPSADGFNTNWYSLTEPKNPRIRDVWYQPDPEFEGHYIIQMWTGEIWQELIRTKNWKVVSEKLKQLETQATEANQKADSISEKADEAISTATGAKDIAERGKQLADELSAHRTKIDDEINRLKERNTINDEVTAEFITNKELIRYNENRWLGEPYGNLDQGDNCIPIRHNGGGFLIGKEYTVSMIIYPMDKPNIEAPIYMGAYVESEVKYG